MIGVQPSSPRSQQLLTRPLCTPATPHSSLPGNTPFSLLFACCPLCLEHFHSSAAGWLPLILQDVRPDARPVAGNPSVQPGHPHNPRDPQAPWKQPVSLAAAAPAPSKPSHVLFVTPTMEVVHGLWAAILSGPQPRAHCPRRISVHLRRWEPMVCIEHLPRTSHQLLHPCLTTAWEWGGHPPTDG